MSWPPIRHGSRVRPQHPEQYLHQRGLARAVHPDQRVDLAGPDLQLEVVHSDAAAVRPAHRVEEHSLGGGLEHGRLAIDRPERSDPTARRPDFPALPSHSLVLPPRNGAETVGAGAVRVDRAYARRRAVRRQGLPIQPLACADRPALGCDRRRRTGRGREQEEDIMSDERVGADAGPNDEVVTEFDQTNGQADGLDGDDGGELQPADDRSLMDEILRGVDDDPSRRRRLEPQLVQRRGQAVTSDPRDARPSVGRRRARPSPRCRRSRRACQGRCRRRRQRRGRGSACRFRSGGQPLEPRPRRRREGRSRPRLTVPVERDRRA